MKKLIIVTSFMLVGLFATANSLTNTSVKNNSNNLFDAFGKCTITITTTDEWGCATTQKLVAETSSYSECEQLGAGVAILWQMFM